MKVSNLLRSLFARASTFGALNADAIARHQANAARTQAANTL